MVNLLPHLVKFVESKSQVLFEAENPQPGDVALFCLLLQVVKAVAANKFFDFDFCLKSIITVLINIALCSRFHELASLNAIMSLKEKNACLLISLVSNFHQQYELKVGYADFLLK